MWIVNVVLLINNTYGLFLLCAWPVHFVVVTKAGKNSLALGGVIFLFSAYDWGGEGTLTIILQARRHSEKSGALPRVTWPVMGRFTPRSVQHQSLNFFLSGERGHAIDNIFILRLMQIKRQGKAQRRKIKATHNSTPWACPSWVFLCISFQSVYVPSDLFLCPPNLCQPISEGRC